VNQTVPPRECILVDDGSTDGTPEIIRSFAARFPWIHSVQRTDRGVRQRGAGVVQAFYDGMAQATDPSWDFVVKLDADLAFPPFYFEELLRRFAQEPRLGIASGSMYIFRGGRWILDKAPKDRTWGPSKIYRRACFEAIGGLVPHLGWDAIDDFKAQMHGWQTRTFEDLVVLHYRPVGKRSGAFNSGVEHGRGNYFLGTHPLFIIVRGLYRMGIDRPIVVAGMGILYGYFRNWFRRTPRIEDPELIQYIQRVQLSRLCPLLTRSEA
jgi:glycosyltransferase involved in cell wall biosynthesis